MAPPSGLPLRTAPILGLPYAPAIAPPLALATMLQRYAQAPRVNIGLPP